MNQNNKIVITEKFIDLEKVFSSKNQSVVKYIPKFVFKYLNRIIHTEKLNAFLYKHRDIEGFDFVDAVIRDFNIKVKVTGIENIPSTGNQFLVSNHPLGGLDGIALFYAVKNIRQDVKFPVNDILMNLPQLTPLFIPINKHGRNVENVKILENAFASDEMLLFFPAGLVSRRSNGVIKDLEWKHTFITKSIKYKRDVIPTFFGGFNSNFFYNLAYWRKRLGIKANIEMLYLVDELYKQINNTLHIHFGKPIPYTMFDKSKSPKEWAAWVKEHVYSMQLSNI